MGSCFSKRKRGGVAAITHNASPRISFSSICKADPTAFPSALRAHKRSEEMVVVVSKDSAALLTNTRNSAPAKKFASTPVPCTAQQPDTSKPNTEQAHNVLPSNCVVNSVLSSPSICQDEKAVLCQHSPKSSTSPSMPSAREPSCGMDVVQHVDSSTPGIKELRVSPSFGFVDDEDADDRNIHQAEVPVSIDDEFVIETTQVDSLNSSLAKLKRSRSCEESVLSDTKRPLRRRSFQETSAFSLRSSRLETIPEPHFGTTKFLEGLDLVEVLPQRSSHSEVPSRINGELEHESNGLSADFFAFKNRYLSSHAVHDRCKESPLAARCDNATSVQDDCMMGSFGHMHSRASSIDSVDLKDAVNGLPSSRHRIPVVEEEKEDECGSDDSETFEFKQAVSVYSHVQSQKKAQLRERIKEEEGRGGGRAKELSVVATGDALLYRNSNSEEFDLIPSKSFSPKKASHSCSSNQITFHSSHGQLDDEEENFHHSSLSVEDIIFLLERDELDEDVLLSFLNLAKNTTTSSHAGNNTPSCHASDVASEASFEFKVKSSGSTPHSTPSTPMLSAGSTPKRITQLSPLTLTPEEIAEIWGVFEQRQALSPFQI